MKISVIIPVYNVEKYLNRCIDSVLNQSFTDFEVLLINDGSTDKSGDICDEYAQKDFRVKVFHKVNGGVSSARNLGLDNATGEWVTFVDSDDYISNNYFDHVGKEYDLILLTVIRFKNDKLYTLLSFPTANYDFNNFLDNYSLYPHFPGPWGKFFKKKLIDLNRLRYDENIHFGEDALFNISYLLYVKKIKTLSEVNYYYRDSDDSLSKKKYSYKEEEYFFNEIMKVLKLYNDNYLLIRNAVYPLNRLLIALYEDDTIVESKKKDIMRNVIVENYDSISFLYKNSKLKYLIILSYKLNRYSVLHKFFKTKLLC